MRRAGRRSSGALSVRVLVTGGSGFIGSHLVDALVCAGHEVVVVDRRPPAYANPEAAYVQADVRDVDAWSNVLEGVDAVSHQAARVGLGVRFADVTDYVEDNDVGTAVLLSALDAAGFAGRLVVAGSMVVYGEGAYRCPRCGPACPGPRPADRLAAGLFEPACSGCGGDLLPRGGDRVCANRPAQHLRRHQGPPGASVRHVRSGARRPRDRPAVSQRLRAPLPGRHALRRGRQPVPRRLAPW